MTIGFGYDNSGRKGGTPVQYIVGVPFDTGTGVSWREKVSRSATHGQAHEFERCAAHKFVGDL